VDYNFEDGAGSWSASNASILRVCGSGVSTQGRCALYVDADRSSTSTWVYQEALTRNFVAPEGGTSDRLAIGGNTGFQYEGLTRCPPQPGTDRCEFDIWIKGDNGDAWNASKHATARYQPDDGDWYYSLEDSFAEGGETEGFEIWINTKGHDMWLDAQWASGGY
jgi:hypothetical protein